MIDYYGRRAEEYEQIYKKPERQTDLIQLDRWLCNQLRQKKILEVACGTGYWTYILATIASSIVAVDASPEVLRIAESKTYPPERVRFQQADAYHLEDVQGSFDAVFAGFWWSHVPLAEHDTFLTGLHHRLGRGHLVVMVDNRFVQGSSTPISRKDAGGDTYQIRILRDGTHHEVVKNFPSRLELETVFGKHGAQLQILELEYYWAVRYFVDDDKITPSD